jgi:hypothetical protein
MFLIDVESALGVPYGPGPITTAVEVKTRQALDQVGSASFRVPAEDARTDLIAAGRYYHISRWDSIRQTRQDLGTWRHRTARIVQGGDAALLEVQCDSLLAEWTRELVYFHRNYSNTATNTVVAALIGLAAGWAGGTVANPGNVSVGFEGDSLFRALVAIAETWVGYHFRETTPARTLDFDDFGDDSGIRLIMPSAARVELEDNDLVALITAVEVVEETDRIVNKIVPVGAGLGETQLNIFGAAADPGYPVQVGVNADASNYYFVHDAASIAAYGQVAAVMAATDVRPLSNSDNDVQYAKNVLYRRAVSALTAHKDPLTVYGVTVAKLRGTLEVGDKVRLVYRGVATRDGTPYKFVDVDALQYVVAIDSTYGQSGAESFRLELSASGYGAGSDGDLLSQMQHDLDVWKTHIQTYPCRTLDTRYEEMDDTHDVIVPVDIDDGVLYLNSALLRLQTRPLRATAKGALGGGATTQTTSSGGGTTQTSSSGGGETKTSSSGGGETVSSEGTAHEHVLAVLSKGTMSGYQYVADIPASTSGSGVLDKIAQAELEIDDDGGTDWARIGTYDDSPAHTHDVTTNDHTHDVTTSNHTHDVTIPNHTHDVTLGDHTHALDYGIYDDVEYPDTVRIAINGVDRTAALGGPWGAGGIAVNEELEITTYLVNAVGGLRQLHEITISCDAGQGTVETVMKLQLTVQGIAVS